MSTILSLGRFRLEQAIMPAWLTLVITIISIIVLPIALLELVKLLEEDPLKERKKKKEEKKCKKLEEERKNEDQWY